MPRLFAKLITLYFVAWSIAYLLAFASRGDSISFEYYFEYLWLGWSFSGGELVMFIWYLSALIFFVFLVAWFGVRFWHRGKLHA